MKIIQTAPDPLIADYLEARVARDQAQVRLDELGERLMKQMEADQRKSWRWKSGGHQHTLTFVRKSTMVIDEPGLRKALTAKVFDKYTKRVLDKKAMEEAMGDGTVDPKVVSKYVSPKPAKPYLDYRDKPTESSTTTEEPYDKTDFDQSYPPMRSL